MWPDPRSAGSSKAMLALLPRQQAQIQLSRNISNFNNIQPGPPNYE